MGGVLQGVTAEGPPSAEGKPGSPQKGPAILNRPSPYGDKKEKQEV